MPILRPAVLSIRDDNHHARVLSRIDQLTKELINEPSPGKRRQMTANREILQEMADAYLTESRTLSTDN